ncbi:MAG TPA: DUF916 domain-containing protein [Patescibacteria group bacterium]|jgi:hypothetical protein|nr:DUF916 domain-containing protein [Patescibacteria group bacterium]
MSYSIRKQAVLKVFQTLALAFVLSFGLISSNSALAQGTGTNRPEQGLAISPFILERQIDKGQSTSETIEVTNTTDKTLPVDISINDFTASGDNGQQTFIAPGEGDQTYALSKWITITNNPKLVLKPGEKTEVSFTLTAPQNAEDGGHYGAIIFSFTPAQSSGSSVAVSQKVAAIILAKTGKAREEGTIADFKAKDFISQSAPITFQTRFKNTGNVHVKPRGQVVISNMFGKKVGTALVNPNGNNVLPNSERVFDSNWDDKFAFGRYTATVELVYGESGQVVKEKTSFWVIPFKLVGGIAIILIILVLILIFGVRRYNRWFMARLMEQSASKKRSKK